MLIPFAQLFHRHKIQLKDVLHIGANTGQEAAEYERHSAWKVIWVEAHKPTFARLTAHIRQYPLHRAIHACVSDRDGQQVEFNVASNGAQSSSILEFGTHSKEHPTVKFVDKVMMATSRTDTLMESLGIDFNTGAFLNIDLQGAELLALKGMGAMLAKFDHLYLEVNEKELYLGCPLVGDLDAFLAPLGFKRKETKMTGSGWGDALYGK